MPRLKLGLKAGLFMAAVSCLAVAVVALGAYIFARQILFANIRDANLRIAKVGAEQITQMISKDIKYLKAFANSPFWKEPLRASNDDMTKTDGEERQLLLEKIDREWLISSEDSDLIKGYLASPLSARLKELIKQLPYVTEIFVTNRFGAIIAASNRTTDYYQADEEWWQKAASEDLRGIVNLEGIIFDVSSNVFGLSVIIPILDTDQSLLGVAKIIIDSNMFRDFFATFKTSRYCHTFLVDQEGRVVSHVESETMNVPILPLEEFKRLVREHFIITARSAAHRSPTMMFYEPLSEETLSANRMDWGVVLEEPVNTAMMPIRNFAGRLIGLACGLFILVLAMTRFFGSVLARPVVQLKEDIAGVVAGDFEFRPKPVVSDELDEIANLFNEVIEKSKAIQESGFRQAHEVEVAYDKLQRMNEEFRVTNIELTVLKNELAQKVDDRTKYLLSTQEAVVNMMEDLQASKDEVEKTNAELKSAYEELKETQRRLVQSEKMAALGRFSAGIAHEVKNPLGIMLGGMEYLQLKMAKADEDTKTVLTKIKDAVLRADRILQGLLKFARPTKLETEVTSPAVLIEELLGLFRYKFPLVNIDIITEFKDSSMKIDVDKNQIQQVFFNLLVNSMDAMPKGGKLSIAVHKSKGELPILGTVPTCVIEIKDTGMGISKDDLPRMFEPFFTTKRDTGGTGLGLAVAKSIIDDHNGTMTIQSEVGKGTAVTIKLPAVEGK